MTKSFPFDSKVYGVIKHPVNIYSAPHYYSPLLIFRLYLRACSSSSGSNNACLKDELQKRSKTPQGYIYVHVFLVGEP